MSANYPLWEGEAMFSEKSVISSAIKSLISTTEQCNVVSHEATKVGRLYHLIVA